MGNIQGYYREVIPADIRHIARNLRRADIAEMHAVHGIDCKIAKIMHASVAMTPNAQIRVSSEGEPIALRGCAPLPGTTTGIPWLLATDKAFRLPAAFLVEGRQFVTENLLEFTDLVNYVDVRNLKSVHWLARIGFKIHAPEPFGIQGLPFHKFTAGGTRALPSGS